MFTKSGLGNLMQQAQKMQEKISEIKKEIINMEVTGESGAGLVKVTINGAHHCKRIEIDCSLMKDDKEILEDLTAAAFNDAERKITEVHKKKMASISTGVELPTDLNLPL